MIRWLGIASFPAFVRARDGIGRAEQFIRTLKEKPLRVGTVETLAELRQTLPELRRSHNAHRLIWRHGHRSPDQFRRDRLDTRPMAA